jgi:hypothetical protein
VLLRRVTAGLKPFGPGGVRPPEWLSALSVIVMSTNPRLELARNLVRLYREVLEQPIPAELAALLERLEAQEALS